VRQLGGIGVRVDERHRFGQTFERLLPLALPGVSRGEIAEQRGSFGTLRLLPEGRSGLVSGGAPIAALDRGLSRKTMENATLGAGERLVADEVVEASPEACSDYLQGAKRGTHETGFDLTDEAFRELVTGKLGLAHAKLAASGANPFAQGHRLLNDFRQTGHRRSPV
jgi:hypothetical protein